MEDKNNDTSKDETERTELDEELDKTFPASDPPSHIRPGHKRDDEDDK